MGATTHLDTVFCFLGVTALVVAALCFVYVMTHVTAAFTGTVQVVSGVGNSTFWPVVGLGLLVKYTT